ncbi:MAG: hypothetical protein RJA51_1654 [Actinomycetota bacterium]
MKSRAAVLRGIDQAWQIEEITVDPPKANEVLVNWKVAGMCHSDEHFVTGDMVPPQDLLDLMGAKFFPFIGGHEGAGIVMEVGPGVTSVKPGDHVSASFVPSCGRCRYCSTGRQNLCNYGAGTLMGHMITDGTPRHFDKDGNPVTMMAKLGTFSEYACVRGRGVAHQGGARPPAGRRGTRVVRRRHRLGLGDQARRHAAR